MSLKHIIEAWRDEEYRESLDEETRSLLPASPAGEIELTDAELSEADGGTISILIIVSVRFSIEEGCIKIPMPRPIIR